MEAWERRLARNDRIRAEIKASKQRKRDRESRKTLRPFRLSLVTQGRVEREHQKAELVEGLSNCKYCFGGCAVVWNWKEKKFEFTKRRVPHLSKALCDACGQPTIPGRKFSVMAWLRSNWQPDQPIRYVSLCAPCRVLIGHQNLLVRIHWDNIELTKRATRELKEKADERRRLRSVSDDR